MRSISHFYHFINCYLTVCLGPLLRGLPTRNIYWNFNNLRSLTVLIKFSSILRNSRFESGPKCQQQGDQKADFRSWVFVCSGSGHTVLLLRLRLKEPRACEVCHGRSCKNCLVSRKFWSNCTYESFWRRSWRLLSSSSCPADWLLAHGRRTRTRSQGLWGLERVLILSHW